MSTDWMYSEARKTKLQKGLDELKRNKFINNLKTTAEENPLAVLLAGAAVLTGIAKIVKAYGDSKGSRAYAKQVNYRINKRNHK